MRQDAEANAEEDKKRREAVDARNHADALIHSTEKSLEEAGNKVASGDKKAVEDAIASLKAVLENESAGADEIKAKTDELTQKAMKIGEALYKAQQESEAQGGNKATESKDDDGVVDAEFSEVKE